MSPWLNAVDVLQQAFTGPLARGLSLIAIVIGGLMFAFGEGGSKPGFPISLWYRTARTVQRALISGAPT